MTPQALLEDTMEIQDLLPRIAELEPLIREHAAEAERERRLSSVVADALRDAGCYRMFRPRSRGGFEVDPGTCFRVIEELSRIDSAAGWNVAIGNATDAVCVWFEDSGTDEMFDTPGTVLSGAWNPPRRAVPTDGGYLVSGNVAFNSNCHAADWMVGLAHVYDGDAPRLDEAGEPVTIITAIPAQDATIVDNWDTMGMCGTGSHDVVVDNLFVPERRAMPFGPFEELHNAYSGPLYRMATWIATATQAPPALGIAQAAIDELIALGEKVPSYIPNPLRERISAQTQLATAAAKVGSARAFLYDVYGRMYEQACNGVKPNMDQRAELQLASTHAVMSSVEAVELVTIAAGTSGIRKSHNFEKHFRDIHVIQQHAFISQSRLEAVGQVMFGVEPNWGFFHF